MNKYLLTALKFLVFLGLGILLIWLSVRNLTEKEIAEIKTSLAEANYFWVVFSMGAGFLSHFIRAIRWRMLLAPLGLVPKLSNTFYAVMIGYLGNLALPRLGEVLRCGILKRYEKIPLTQSFGTVIAERVIDLFVLFLLFIVSIWLQYERMKSYLIENIFNPLKLKMHSIADNKLMLLLIIGIAAAGIMFLFLARKKILQNPVAVKITGLLKSFLEGIRSVGNVKTPFLFIFHSLFIWVLYLMSVYLCVFAFDGTQSLTPVDCLVILTFGSFGVIATPGGIGAYQWIVMQIMMLWGYTASMGVAFGWVVWLAQTTVVLLFGLLSFGLLAINNKEE